MIRREVLRFTDEMERVLKENDHKGGWSENECTESYLRARLVEEMGEYFGLVSNDEEFTVSPALMRNPNIDGGNLQQHRNKIKKELVDIANFAMMLWDRA
jgi:NTP pyrophosphatase (non-canonical NTP hydrolase)